MFTLLLSLVGCNDTIYYWEFNEPSSSVEEISIVYIDSYALDELDMEKITIIKKIDISLAKDFYADILTLEMRKYFRVEFDYPSEYSFLIKYDEETYCILSTEGSGYYYNQEYRDWSFEYHKKDFDEDSFTNLINKYLCE